MTCSHHCHEWHTRDTWQVSAQERCIKPHVSSTLYFTCAVFQISVQLFDQRENLILSDLMHNRSIETLGVRTIENNYMFCPFVHLCEEQRNEESSGMKLFRKVFMACTLLALCALTLVWSRSALHSSSIFKPAHFSIPIISVTNHFVSSDWVLHEREFIRQGKISSWK